MSQGQGAGTERKQLSFFHVMRLGMRVAARNSKLLRYPFWLFDGNCGEGINRKVETHGSPFVAHHAADEEKLSADRRRFFFCDRERELIERLNASLACRPEWSRSSYCLFGDNESGLRLFAETIGSEENPKYAVGLIVIDPNGWYYRSKDGIGVPTNQLIEVAARFPRLDILLHLNAFHYWQLRGKGADALPPYDVLASLSRKHWLVGKISVGQSRFFVAIGRNFATGEHQAIKFYHLESDMGREVMNWAKAGEKGRQMGLFNAALSDVSGISGAPSLQDGEGDRNPRREGPLPVRSGSDRSSPLAPETGHLPAVELLRRPGQSEADLP